MRYLDHTVGRKNVVDHKVIANFQRVFSPKCYESFAKIIMSYIQDADIFENIKGRVPIPAHPHIAVELLLPHSSNDFRRICLKEAIPWELFKTVLRIGIRIRI